MKHTASSCVKTLATIGEKIAWQVEQFLDHSGIVFDLCYMQIILLLMCNELLTMADVLKTVVCLFVVYLLRLVPTSCKYTS